MTQAWWYEFRSASGSVPVTKVLVRTEIEGSLKLIGWWAYPNRWASGTYHHTYIHTITHIHHHNAPHIQSHTHIHHLFLFLSLTHIITIIQTHHHTYTPLHMHTHHYTQTTHTHIHCTWVVVSTHITPGGDTNTGDVHEFSRAPGGQGRGPLVTTTF